MSDLLPDSNVPACRQRATAHLAAAAKEPLGSVAENYLLLAAIAESLVRIERHLATLAKRSTS